MSRVAWGCQFNLAIGRFFLPIINSQLSCLPTPFFLFLKQSIYLIISSPLFLLWFFLLNLMIPPYPGHSLINSFILASFSPREVNGHSGEVWFLPIHLQMQISIDLLTTISWSFWNAAIMPWFLLHHKPQPWTFPFHFFHCFLQQDKKVIGLLCCFPPFQLPAESIVNGTIPECQLGRCGQGGQRACFHGV